MFFRTKTLLQPAPARYLNFIPLSRLAADEAGTWHRCEPLILSNEAYDWLHEFLQANLDVRWSLMLQDRDQLDRYDILLEVETEAGLPNLFRATIEMVE